MELLKDKCYKICTVIRNENESILKDCNDHVIATVDLNGNITKYDKQGIKIGTYSPNDNITYTGGIKSAYRKKAIYNDKRSAVWILVANDKNEAEKYLQIGRNINPHEMLNSDIYPDIHSIISGNSKNKYHNIESSSLSFFQVDIDAYLNNDLDIHKVLKSKVPTDSSLKQAYYNFKAAYCEGKLAYESNASLWKRSGGIDGDIFDFFAPETK